MQAETAHAQFCLANQGAVTAFLWQPSNQILPGPIHQFLELLLRRTRRGFFLAVLEWLLSQPLATLVPWISGGHLASRCDLRDSGWEDPGFLQRVVSFFHPSRAPCECGVFCFPCLSMHARLNHRRTSRCNST